jgi:hypothetical protein
MVAIRSVRLDSAIALIEILVPSFLHILVVIPGIGLRISRLLPARLELDYLCAVCIGTTIGAVDGEAVHGPAKDR